MNLFFARESSADAVPELKRRSAGFSYRGIR